MIERVPTSVLSAEPCHLGEGPSYDVTTDTAWWFDIREGRLFEAHLGSRSVRTHALGRMASALGRIDAERQLIVAEDGLYIRNVADGLMSLFCPLEADKPDTRSNDSRVHPSGTFWIGTMGKQAERGAGAIYALHRGNMATLFPGISIPNSICFSPDGATGYFTDTAHSVLYAVPLDPATGLPRGEPEVLLRHSGTGGLDGSVCDADGQIWNACWGAGRIDVYSPQGERMRSLSVPARQSSCPAFVGSDLSRLLVTSAWQDMDAAARVGDPQAGYTFLLEASARGRAEPDVKLA
ncbi:SMP-30/gluconolactonase/LRE family protein [Bradyrhizobium diazoefficiens]|jgi:sugar lactone lactonase YvrE|nr:SMP-30/gluconolactonase/LRE family protein [Bradyrhizobium diazoefficiens]MBR0963896.1 SMP-30/gluconolactonase/LRE family protein [Bradyrhizobium diazoefficiens]MBR0978047.1 SMP-30/gluconolactonase/LRE family protein [Bradyrhizobium diazoefficiens]MBR1007556.1 SMP-30/gluconolactonase/LRE family protein [Bradyrhizobium diazoefficiens]MBR1012601.1 SMP-30/gluconolactonase/LRE family protein [Bradyrhizobium diazoefficiens]MBR1053636.1 SMP-30/gluconolactonase/LRE family protein [Bradyrhizobium d